MSTGDTRDRNETDTKEATTWLLPEQVQQLRTAAVSGGVPTHLQDRDLALVGVLYDLGLRRSEAAQLDVEHVDLVDGTVYLPSDLQKAGAPPVPLEFGKWGFDAAVDVGRYLGERADETGPVFISREGERVSGRLVTRRVKRLAQLADVSPQIATGGTGTPDQVTAHTLRHSMAYRIIREQGGRLEDVQIRLRHASRQVTDRIYSHLVPR